MLHFYTASMVRRPADRKSPRFLCSWSAGVTALRGLDPRNKDLPSVPRRCRNVHFAPKKKASGEVRQRLLPPTHSPSRAAVNLSGVLSSDRHDTSCLYRSGWRACQGATSRDVSLFCPSFPSPAPPSGRTSLSSSSSSTLRPTLPPLSLLPPPHHDFILPKLFIS